MIRKHSGFLAAAICSILCFTTLKTYAMSEGYVLTGAYGGTKTMLFDSLGKTVFEWDHSSLTNPKCGYSCYLLENGNLLRSAIVPEGTTHSSMSPAQGIIQELDPDGNIVWSYTLASTDSGMLHHDMKPMPNGHILAVAYVPLTKQQLRTCGIDTALIPRMSATKFLLSERIIEIDPKAAGGPKIVWEWKIHDHVIPGAQAANHPELISGTIVPQAYFGNQWVHLNGLDYNAEHDLILFSSRVFSECYIIDHNTTTQEAAGHTGGGRGKGGDILYRWGNPANYKVSGATKLNVLHCVNFIPKGYPGEGNVIFFHNNSSATSNPGHGVEKTTSQVIEIKLPVDDNFNFSKSAGQPFGPTSPTWIFAPSDSFSSPAMSSAFRLPNGNTLAHLAYPSNNGSLDMNTNSQLLEIDKNQKILWKYTIVTDPSKGATPNPGGMMNVSYNPAKIMYYNKNYVGIKKLLSDVSTQKPNNTAPIVQTSIDQSFGKLTISGINASKIHIFNIQGKRTESLSANGKSITIDTYRYSAGVYYAKIVTKTGSEVLTSFHIMK